MTLNLTEAGAVNTVIEHLTGAFPGTVHTCRPLPDRAQAILAFASLADAAYRRLSAGYSGERALEALEAHWPGALREIWMLELHGVDGEPFATEQAARRHATTAGGWAPNDDLAWRPGLADSETGRTAKVLYANGHRTLCTIWPVPIRGLGAEAAAADAVDAPDESVATCKVCGCTEDDPCDGGCAWATGSSLEIDLCTACEFAIVRDGIKSGRCAPFRYRLPEATSTAELAAAIAEEPDPMWAITPDSVVLPVAGDVIAQLMAATDYFLKMPADAAPSSPEFNIITLPKAAQLPPERLAAFQTFCREVWAECDRQWAKWGDQRHPDGTDRIYFAPRANQYRDSAQASAELGEVTWTDILLEEAFEAFAEEQPAPLRAELVQSAAVIASWLADMNRRGPAHPAALADAPAPTGAPEPGSTSASDNEAFSDANRPLGERDTA